MQFGGPLYEYTSVSDVVATSPLSDQFAVRVRNMLHVPMQPHVDPPEHCRLKPESVNPGPEHENPRPKPDSSVYASSAHTVSTYVLE